MSAEDVELVRRIYTAWDRGDFSHASWAADDIHFQTVGSVVPVDVRGGKVVRLVLYVDAERALAQLAIDER